MATQASPSSSCLKIIIGSNTSSSEDSTESERTSTTNVTTDAEQRGSEVEVQSIVGGQGNMEDVLPTYVLQPKEISKNIDLMKTVAMLMESKLQQPLRGTDTEKMRDLYSDIQRFPEAYQKFTSIVHQIQYLNVTGNWDVSGEPEPNKANLLTKFLQSSKFSSDSEQDGRKRVMLGLVNEVFRVFGRYQAIQVMLEERLKNFSDFILKKSIELNLSFGAGMTETKNIAPRTTQSVEYSDEDDPQQPLLNSGGASNPDRKLYTSLLERCEVLSQILRKARRQATEVHDSADVLRDLINWDHKQVTLKSSGLETECNDSYQHSSNTHHPPEVVIHPLRNNPQVNCRGDTMSQTSQNRKVWIVGAVILFFLVLLLVLTAAFSFLPFNY